MGESVERSAAKAVQSEIDARLDESAAELVQRLWDMTDATRPYTVSCPKCGKRSEVLISDTSGAIKAVTALLDRHIGRPKQAESVKAGWSFTRSVVPPASVPPDSSV